MKYLHYKNGQWVGEDKLNVSVYDLSVLRGFGIFDFMRTYNRKFFRIDDNIERFSRSASILGLKLPVSEKKLKTILAEGLKRNKNGDIGVRLVLTGGKSKDFITPGKPDFFVLFSKAIMLPDNCYEQGVSIVTEPSRRLFAQAKSLNYLAAVRAMARANQVGAIEALYIDPPSAKHRHIYECTTSNFFAVINGKIVTPEDDILHGITRKAVLEMAEDMKLPLELRPIELYEIAKFDEAFLTAANKGVVPIVKIDRKNIGNGAPGPITKKLVKGFRELTKYL